MAMLAPITLATGLKKVLELEGEVSTNHAKSMVLAAPLVLRAYEIAANVYRCGGCTSGQVKALEEVIIALKELVA